MNLEEASRIFSNDLFATERVGAEIIAIGTDYAKVGCDISPGHLNARGAVMGGVYFTLADFCFAVASNIGDYFTVSVNSSISFLAPAKGKKLFAESRLLKNGSSLCFYEISVTDDMGTLCALVNATGAKKHK